MSDRWKGTGMDSTGARTRLGCRVSRMGLFAAVVGLLVPAAVLSSVSSAAADPVTRVFTFHFTGGAQTFTVPPEVTSVTFDLFGGQGGYGGANGGETNTVMTVTPGTVYQVNVGGAASNGAAGWNGGAAGGNAPGGDPGGGGGGAV